MAAGWAARLGGDAVDVLSGGSDPAEAVNPAAAEAMAEVGVDLVGQVPKRWSDGMVRTADIVITMGCGDACPIYPGTRYEDWEIPDPAGQGIDAVRPIRDDIERRVRELLVELGIDPLG